MSTYGNFLFRIGEKFIPQPDAWCIAFIGRNYGSWEEGVVIDRFLSKSFPGKVSCYDYYEQLNLLKLEQYLEDKKEEWSYDSVLRFFIELSKEGHDIDIFYQNEYYECIGSYGMDTTQQDLESGLVKNWTNKFVCNDKNLDTKSEER